MNGWIVVNSGLMLGSSFEGWTASVNKLDDTKGSTINNHQQKAMDKYSGWGLVRGLSLGLYSLVYLFATCEIAEWQVGLMTLRAHMAWFRNWFMIRFWCHWANVDVWWDSTNAHPDAQRFFIWTNVGCQPWSRVHPDGKIAAGPQP